MTPEMRFLEYLYCHHPSLCAEEEKRFMGKMSAIHRTTRDPTFDRPEWHTKNMQTLYLFPYSSEILSKPQKEWAEILPQHITSDIFGFFEKNWKSGSKEVFLQCADGRHVVCNLIQSEKT